MIIWIDQKLQYFWHVWVCVSETNANHLRNSILLHRHWFRVSKVNSILCQPMTNVCTTNADIRLFFRSVAENMIPQGVQMIAFEINLSNASRWCKFDEMTSINGLTENNRIDKFIAFWHPFFSLPMRTSKVKIDVAGRIYVLHLEILMQNNERCG